MTQMLVQMFREKDQQDRPQKNDPRLQRAMDAIPEEQRSEAMQDALNSISRYVPPALDAGMGRRLTNEQVRAYIATEGHRPKELPDIILAGDRALVREVDRSGYFKLVQDRGVWFCGCSGTTRTCVHKAALQANLRAKGAA